VAGILVQGPTRAVPASADAAQALGASFWPLAIARELEDAILHLRFNEPKLGVILLRTEGDPEAVLDHDRFLAGAQDHWLMREIRHYLKRVFKRLDVTARSFFAVVDDKSCFAGPLFELLVAADRSYVLDAEGVAVRPGSLSGGALPGWNGLSRLQTRFLADPKRADAIVRAGKEGPIDAGRMGELGLATVLADEIDFEEELRVAVEERVSLSPDALTGMEASYRFAGPETLATKIFGRLSAWQNWIFIRPNATGETGALTLYGEPERPKFDWRRT